ncbi:MAG: DEAD/DEAH box helicase [Promethearchaeota archaeon]
MTNRQGRNGDNVKTTRKNGNFYHKKNVGTRTKSFNKPRASFHDFNWKKKEIPIILKEVNYIKPTEIQERSIPLALAGKNVIGQSKTGTGKTLAFSLPIIDKINAESRFVQAVIITPTRELCGQVASTLDMIAKRLKIGVLKIYGGVDINRQKTALKSGKIHVIVATPGRLIDLFKQGFVNFRNINTFVLDEADRMLDMGFMPDIEFIMRQMPANKNVQLMLFSATIFKEIMDSIRKITRGRHVIVRVGKNEDEFVIKEIKQEKYMIMDRSKKYSLLKSILKKERPKHCLIFSNTINGVEFLARRLKSDLNYPVLALTGKINQGRREKILNLFKTHKIHHLIATDVASRGLDIPNITHVINYDVPEYPENYVHRIGRTGRVDKFKDGRTMRGKAITLCTYDELIYMQRIEGLIQKEIPQIESEMSFRPRHPFFG